MAGERDPAIMGAVMKERPIIMTGESVRAILDRRKTQTRRVIKFTYPTDWIGSVNPDGKDGWIAWGPTQVPDDYSRKMYPNGGGFKCPYGVPGDRLWVREKFKIGQGRSIVYFDTPSRWAEGMSWKRSIFMPRWASRITLEVVSVRVERLQEISHEDALSEGLICYHENYQCALEEYPHLWDILNAKRGYPWSSNPWVWVVEFRKVKL